MEHAGVTFEEKLLREFALEWLQLQGLESRDRSASLGRDANETLQSPHSHMYCENSAQLCRINISSDTSICTKISLF